MPKKVLVLLAEGFEEVEAVMPVDILRRAGLNVTITSLGENQVTGAHGLTIVADSKLLDIDPHQFDALVIHGGMPGAENLANDKNVFNIIKDYHQRGKLIAAICASPAFVLAPTGILSGKKATCFPGCEDKFDDKTTFVIDRVVVDGSVITSRGLGTAHDFALTIVGYLCGQQKADEIAAQTLR
ncbi:MAG: DJ-1/PfpI family protein [Candidatus Omnitrophica bacterium]|nr:DJ-1/PfpI family protein [Candidatus Omnitrophota bacterium]